MNGQPHDPLSKNGDGLGMGESPQVYRFLLRQSDIDGAEAALGKSDSGVSWARAGATKNGVLLDVTSSTPQRDTMGRILSVWRSIITPLDVWPRDLVDQVSEHWLREQIRGAASRPLTRVEEANYWWRLERLTGAETLRQLLALVRDPREVDDARWKAASTCGVVLRNSRDAGLVQDVLDASIDLSRAGAKRGPYARSRVALELVEAVTSMFESFRHWPARTCEFSSEQSAPVEPRVRALLTHPWAEFQWRTLTLATTLHGHRDTATADALAAVALARASTKGQDAGVVNTAAAEALAICPPTPAVREALLALRGAHKWETRVTATMALCALDDPALTRSLWSEWSVSRSANDRAVAYFILAERGTAEDLDAAVAALAAVLRWTRPDDDQIGRKLFDLLCRNGAASRARTELEHARRRKAGVPPVLEAWIEVAHPTLTSRVPADRK
ncbi:hypothetical protein [Cellulomonas sp. Leaf334]|uniref:hypothetical protein n=1 Tax=Cellulomonas sp. Leaf334 TaxID=1736339 RepID=UPI000A8F6A0F|nr:hypothetical protein [Cellulomonas sp. Leaf334]